MRRFSEDLWSETSAIYAAILELPFNRDLAAGSLERDKFLFYMIQDAHYLGEFACALAVAAAKAPTSDGRVSLARAAAEAITVERALHEDFFAAFGVDEARVQATPPSPTCEAYCDFLLASAYGRSFAVAMAAILPCFKIYWEVGRALFEEVRSPNPYQKWIDTYADPAFGEAVAVMSELTDAAFEQAGESERAAMRIAYRKASRFEWMFWDSAWRQERWPI